MQNNNLFNGNLFQQTPQKNTEWGSTGTGINNGNAGGGAPMGTGLQNGNTNGFSMGNSGPGNQIPGGLFSQQGNTTGYNKPSTLGQFTQGSLFNSFGSSNNTAFNQPYNTQYGGGSWPSSSSGITSKGSKVAPYSRTKVTEDSGLGVECLDITAMKEYNDKCTDIIRIEDYGMMRKPTPKFGTNITNTSSAGGYNSILSRPATTANTTTSPTFGTTTPSFGTATSQPTMATFPSQQLPIPGSSLNTTNASTSNLFGGTGMNAFGGALPNNTIQPSSIQPAAAPPLQLNSMQSTNTSSLFPSNTSLVTNQPLSSTLNPPPTAPSNPLGAAPPTAPTSFGSGLFNFGAASNNFGVSSSNVNNTGNTGIGLNNSMFGGVGNPFTPQTNTAPPPSNVTTNPFNSTLFSNPGMPPAVNMNDPYLIKGLQFSKVESQKLPVKAILPTPIFDTKKPTFMAPILFRPPKKTGSAGITTVPELVDGATNISNFMVKFAGVGKIEYLEPVTVESVESIEKKIKFRNATVEMADEPGTGLNKRARVYVEGVFPFSRASNSFIKGVPTDSLSRSIQDRFIYHLKNDEVKRFVDYDAETGLYIYEVNHF